MGWLRTRTQLRQGTERGMNSLLNTTSGWQGTAPASLSDTLPSGCQEVQLPVAQLLLPKCSPCCCSPVSAKEGKKENSAFVAFRGISLGPLFVGPQGRVGGQHTRESLLQSCSEQFSPCSRTCGAGL